MKTDWVAFALENAETQVSYLRCHADSYRDYLQQLEQKGYTVETWGDGSKANGGLIIAVCKKEKSLIYPHMGEYEVVNTARLIQFYGTYSA